MFKSRYISYYNMLNTCAVTDVLLPEGYQEGIVWLPPSYQTGIQQLLDSKKMIIQQFLVTRIFPNGYKPLRPVTIRLSHLPDDYTSVTIRLLVIRKLPNGYQRVTKRLFPATVNNAGAYRCLVQVYLNTFVNLQAIYTPRAYLLHYYTMRAAATLSSLQFRHQCILNGKNVYVNIECNVKYKLRYFRYTYIKDVTSVTSNTKNFQQK